ncbi:MAG: hypothetical protein ACE5HE_01495 [Phycisphaerae bacterium]
MSVTQLKRDRSALLKPSAAARAVHGALELFSSVWFGILLASMLFIYCSIGSAVPAVRQLPGLEMTEFEWFHWWPFSALVILLCVALVVVTIRRIAFNVINAGVWMVHAGVILLCVGSYYYFGTKVEGDTPVFRRRVSIELPGQTEPATLVALPGAGTTVVAGPNVWRFQIQGTNTAWPILSDEHAGENAYAVNVAVTPPRGEPFVRQLLDGYVQYTEDIIPGKGRAIKSLGRKLVDEDLKLTLEYEPQKYFFLVDSWALFVRRVGDADWVQRPIKGLPRYHDRVASRDQVFSDPRFPVTILPLDRDVPPENPDDPLRGTSVRITGFLRYAHMQRNWRDGGDRLNPVVRVSIASDNVTERSYDLAAFDPRLSRTDDGIIEFRWLPDESMVDLLPQNSRAVLHVAVPQADVSFDLPITQETLVGREGVFTPIDGTEFSYRILSLQDNLALPGDRRSVSVAMVEIKTADSQFTRMVADNAAMTRDMHGSSMNPHGAETPKAAKADPRIQMLYDPQSAPIIIAAHPGGIRFVYNGPDGRRIARDVQPADVVEIMPGLGIRVDSLWLRAVSEVKPYIVPPSQRERNAGATFAMIRLEVGSGGRIETKWLRFHHYPFADSQYAQSERFPYLPQHFHLRDGTTVEVLFSRERRALPSPIALEDFALDTHIGGYTGSQLTIRNYVSRLRFLDDERWTEPTRIAVNAPTEHGGYWYFQSTWDPPSQGDPTGGMNYTGLGVGNRHGVHVQLAGCCLAVAGMMYAFYVKPTLRKRRRTRARTGSLRSDEHEAHVDAAASVAQTA